MSDYDKDDRDERINRLDYAMTITFRRLQQICTWILRDEKLCESWCLEWDIKNVLRESYHACVEAYFGDGKKFDRIIGQRHATIDGIQAMQAYDWSGLNILDGYRNELAKAKVLPKRVRESMVESFKKKLDAERPEREAKHFRLALIRFGTSNLRNIYDIIGMDFKAQVANLRRYLKKIGKESELLDEYGITDQEDAGEGARNE